MGSFKNPPQIGNRKNGTQKRKKAKAQRNSSFQFDVRNFIVIAQVVVPLAIFYTNRFSSFGLNTSIIDHGSRCDDVLKSIELIANGNGGLPFLAHDFLLSEDKCVEAMY